MSDLLCQDLLDHYRKALRLAAETIGLFDPPQWRGGAALFESPARTAYHLVECLDYYFRDPGRPFQWGSRFGGGWWELPEENLPAQAEVLAYLEEVQARIVHQLTSLRDEELGTPYDEEREHGHTRLGHYVYGLRHTMHHHGVLSLLALQQGHTEGGWA